MAKMSGLAGRALLLVAAAAANVALFSKEAQASEYGMGSCWQYGNGVCECRTPITHFPYCSGGAPSCQEIFSDCR
jgi:hypothetical protein